MIAHSHCAALKCELITRQNTSAEKIRSPAKSNGKRRRVNVIEDIETGFGFLETL